NLADAMDMLTHDLGLEWVIKDKTIILRLLEQSTVQKAVSVHGQTSQERTISGMVMDESGVPLESATVAVKGTAVAVTTDSQGHYRITLPNDGHTLLFSILGFQS